MLVMEYLKTPANTPVAAPRMSDASCSQILTINLEDYFQAGVFHRFISPRNWYRFESRLQKNTEDTLALLDENETKATFFVLGWIAERYPELVRRIADNGHEIASRGFLHQPLLKADREGSPRGSGAVEGIARRHNRSGSDGISTVRWLAHATRSVVSE